MDCLLNRPKRLDCEPMDYLTGWSTAAVACWPLSDPEAMRGLQEAEVARRVGWLRRTDQGRGARPLVS